MLSFNQDTLTIGFTVDVMIKRNDTAEPFLIFIKNKNLEYLQNINQIILV